MNKTERITKSYYIGKDLSEKVKEEANQHPYMNASNIVEQAIKEYLAKTEEG